MKIELEPTDMIVAVNGTPCRVWQGQTESGLAINALIALVGCDRDADAHELERALHEVVEPRIDVKKAYRG